MYNKKLNYRKESVRLLCATYVGHVTPPMQPTGPICIFLVRALNPLYAKKNSKSLSAAVPEIGGGSQNFKSLSSAVVEIYAHGGDPLELLC